MGNLLSNVLSTISTLSALPISTSIRSPNSSAAAGATPAQGTGDEESPERPPEGNQSDNNSSGGADETDEGHRDRIAVQTAALAALTFSVQLLVNLPTKVVEPKLQFVYEANVAFLWITFFSAYYTFMRVFRKEEPAGWRHEKKLIVLIYVSVAITFALRVSLHVLFAVSSVRVLLMTAVASLLGWLYLRRT